MCLSKSLFGNRCQTRAQDSGFGRRDRAALDERVEENGRLLHILIAGEDGGLTRRYVQQTLRRGDAALERIIAVGDQAARQLDPGLDQRILESLFPLARGAEAMRAADQADPAMALRD